MTNLTLSTNPGGLRWLADCPRLSGPTASGKLARQSRTVRFDTPDLRLYRRGIALQVSQEGNHFVQRLAVTSDGDEAGDRVWESELHGPDPALERLPETEIGPVLARVARDELVPVMAWRVRRQTRILQEPAVDGSTEIIEIAFDEGEIEGAEAPVPIAEIAFAVLRGPADAPYRLALELLESVPLNIEPRSRFARGLQHVTGMPPRWHKAPRPACKAGTTVDDAMATLFRASLAHFLANEGAALDGRDTEGVHQARVALRRMRSAFSAFGPLLTDPAVAGLKANAKWLADTLGPAREWDVFLSGELAETERRHADDPALAALRRQAESARQAAYRQARSALMSQRTTRFVLELGRWIEAHGWRSATLPLAEDAPDDAPDDAFERPLAGFAAATLDRQYRRMRKRGRGFAHLPAESRHRLRIGVKKLRYTAEFFVLLFDTEAARKFVAEAAALQDALGDMNDVATLSARLDGLQAAAPGNAPLARGVGTVMGAAGVHAAATVESGVRAAWRRFRRMPPFWPSPRRRSP
jgi:inorganic triphosphatase YgiF